MAKPTVSPGALVATFVIAGVTLCLASLAFPADVAGDIRTLGALLLGMAMRRPGDIGATTHPDDV